MRSSVWVACMVAATISSINGSATAEPRKLTSEQIIGLLPTIVAVGQDTKQCFSKSGATTYSQGGRDTYGTWRVDNDLYCSQWPPSADWSCYAVLLDEKTRELVWVAGNGHQTVNTIQNK